MGGDVEEKAEKRERCVKVWIQVSYTDREMDTNTADKQISEGVYVPGIDAKMNILNKRSSQNKYK